MLQPDNCCKMTERWIIMFTFVIYGIVGCSSLNDSCLHQPVPGSALRVRSGFEDFKEMLLWSDAFVDKSLFIKDIVEEFAKVIVIARPRKWGKTLNTNMLKRFLEIETDLNGIPVAEPLRINNRLFEGGTVDLGTDGKHVFKPLKVTNHSKVMEHMGKYPVISISFKPIKGYGFNRILNTLKVQLMKLFKTHSYLRHTISAEEEKTRFDRYTVANITDFDVKHSIKFLSELLYKRCNKNVVLLLDDYDTPIISSYWELMENEQELHAVLQLFRDLFAVSVNNPFVHKSVITGLVLIDRANLFGEVNASVAEYSLHTKKYTNHFGFTTPELDELLAKVPVSMPASEIKRYYNGFAWCEENLFNPHSIMECLIHDGALDQYWIDSASSLTIDVRVFKGTLATDLPLLEEKGLFIYKIYEEINFMEIFEGFKEMWYSLLVMAGYLDVAEDVDYAGDYGYRVWLPNQEMRDKFVPKVLKWIFYDDGDCIVSIDM